VADAALANVFFFRLADGRGRVEIHANLPFARVWRNATETLVPVTLDVAIPPAVQEIVDSAAALGELPRPLGTGERVHRPRSPFIIAAASAGDRVFALVNGGVILQIDSRTGTTDAWPLPAPGPGRGSAALRWSPVALAATRHLLALLSVPVADGPSNDAFVTAWDLRDDAKIR
jgi:hypothetical protein